ncbi:Cellulase (glycosyl hydrolase family 5) [Bremerella volcania]|uniref:Cellulase (Glycosyl hydrolase family 5) n=1 Tax=Bremerella volcania TaxID=2527984 RepID=A0A518CBJ2_9BACT|nr:cellulase family glycosylhydrolase [Bremerella volcania]QDU76596.1 Cellulase (glycosyl hydrolase family 5) [Bremerella volcania]
MKASLAVLFALTLAPPLSIADEPQSKIVLSEDGKDFRLAGTETAFYVWGVNYDHDGDGKLIEDYWHDDWAMIEEDFSEIKSLGANVVRVHLQLPKFMKTASEPNEENLQKLADLVKLAEAEQLYLNLTGLGCYHKQDVPVWYDEMKEADRWQVQANFWKAVAKKCKDSPAVFCYDLMNEPVLGGGTNADQWLVGEPLGGKYFVQRITTDAAGRDNKEIAAAWVKTLTDAIREVDPQTLITVGVIPWAHVWPNAKPLFYSEEVSGPLDFASVHFYPERDGVEKAIVALKVYDIGKPLVIEEFFPLKCSLEEAEQFLAKARPITDGVTSFYWGTTQEEYTEAGTMQGAISAKWLERFRQGAPEASK